MDWDSLFPDEGIAAAMLDRLLHYSKTIKIKDQSYRLAMKKRWDFLKIYETTLLKPGNFKFRFTD